MTILVIGVFPVIIIGILIGFLEIRNKVLFKEHYFAYKEKYLNHGRVLCKYWGHYDNFADLCKHEANKLIDFRPIRGDVISYNWDGCNSYNARGKCIKYVQNDHKIIYYDPK